MRKKIALMAAFTAIATFSTLLAGTPAQAASFPMADTCQNSTCVAGRDYCYLGMGCKCFMEAGHCTGDEECPAT